MEKLCNFSEIFYGENMVNLTPRMLVMRLYADKISSIRELVSVSIDICWASIIHM